MTYSDCHKQPGQSVRDIAFNTVLVFRLDLELNRRREIGSASTREWSFVSYGRPRLPQPQVANNLSAELN